MALQKQDLNINFSSGLDLKTDPFQVQAGKFLSLKNTVFDVGGRITKRNGYTPLPSLPDDTSKYLTTFNGNLTAIGTKLEALSIGSSQWVDKGAIQPIDLSVLPAVRNSTYQGQADSVTASNGLTCVVYTDYIPSAGVVTPSYKYTVIDSVTGQSIVDPVTLDTADEEYGTPRVFLLDNYFVILFTTTGPTYHLQYIALSTHNPTVATTPVDISSSYIPASTLAFDALVVNSTLYIAYYTTSGGASVKVSSLSSSLGNPTTAVTFAGEVATMFSLAADLTDSASPIIYVSYYDLASEEGYTLAIDKNLNEVLAPTATIASGIYNNIASVASSGVATLYFEKANSYGYDASISTNLIETMTITQAGVTDALSTLVRGVGLASKAFRYDSNSYFLAVYNSTFQPSYFLINGDGHIISRLAYGNSGPYCTTGLPNVTLDGDIAKISYLFKATIQAVNPTQGAASAAGVYSQLGVNIATFDFTPTYILTSEIGQNLNITGGFITSYDGVTPVEQNFFLYPEDIEINNPSAIAITGDTTNGEPVIENISSFTNVVVGMNVTGTGIDSDSVIIAIDENNSTITLNKDATATNSSVSLSLSGSVADQQYYYQVTYEWSDNQGNTFRSTPSIPKTITTSGTGDFVTLDIPTLRLTYKIENPVKIVVYRWSVAQQNYYQTTSLTAPLLNDPTVDYVTFVDIHSDAQIIGNNLIYTTGGVLEDMAPPASSIMTLFNNRLWLVDSEDRNLLWFSKPVIEATPVEMSDLLTRYVAPSTASEGSTGPVTAIYPMDDKLVTFKRNALGYISGTGPDNTGSNSSYSDFNLINSVVGCDNPQSIVLTPQGLMFQSTKGIWLLGRDLSTQYIGAPVETLTMGATVLSAINIPDTNQIRFTMDTGITLMYDYYYQQWGSFTNVPALSSTVYQNLHTYINSLGQVFQESPGQYLDNTSPVLMSFTTSWFALAGLQGFERFYQMYLLGTYKSPFKLNVSLAYDYNESLTQSTTVLPESPQGPWGSDKLWGSSSPWGGPSKVFEARVFPQTQKCESFQISVSESYDPQYGIMPGAGLTLSGLNLVIGTKRGFRTSSSKRSFG